MTDTNEEGGGGQGGRTTPEWIAFAMSLLLLGGVVGLIVRDLIEPESPAQPVAKIVGEPRRAGDQFIVTVEVTNEGDETAVEVQVQAELVLGEETLEGDQTLELLPGSATEEVEIVLPEDPAGGELTARVTSFQNP